jgi:hypothetical protein
MDDVAQRDDRDPATNDTDGEQEEEDAGDKVQGRWLPSDSSAKWPAVGPRSILA